MSIEVMKQALEFLEWFAGDDHSIRPKHKAPEIVVALREAIAESEAALREAIAEEENDEEIWEGVQSIDWLYLNMSSRMHDEASREKAINHFVGIFYENAEFVFVKDMSGPWLKMMDVGGLSLLARWIGNSHIIQNEKRSKEKNQ